MFSITSPWGAGRPSQELPRARRSRMLTRFHLSNFRAFRSSQLKLDSLALRPVTLLIGSNAVGKSTMLEGIYFLMTGIDASKRLGGARSSAVSSASLLAALESVIPDVGALFTREGTSIATELSVTGEFAGSMHGEVQLITRRSEDGVLTVHLKHDCSGAGFGSLPPVLQGPSATMIRHVSTIPNDEPFRPDAEVERLSLGGLQAAVLRNRLYRLDDAGLENVNRVLRTLVNAEIVAPPPSGESERPMSLVIHYRRDGHTHELGSGNHALISILSLLVEVETCLSRPSVTGERILLLDEPELHLHPKAHGALAEHLANRATSNGAQIIFVTHSADIANRIGSQTDSAVLAIERPFSTPRRLHSQKELLYALSSTHDLMQFSSLNFLESRRVLFCEGKDDEALLQRCAEAHFHSAPAQRTHFEKWTIVALEGVGNMRATPLMERLVSSPLLPRLGREEALVLVAVNDRDYEREPGRRMQSSKQVERVEQVWPRHSIESLFMEENVLSSMLAALLGNATPSDLVERVRNALDAADHDVDLLEAAEDELAEMYRRTRQHSGKAAQQEARKVVRAHPEIWQRGKDRADFVLRRVRDSLPTELHNRIRASVPKLLNAIPREALPNIVLPAEIVEFLDFLAARA